MEDPPLSSPVPSPFAGHSSRSRSSTKIVDDVTSLTSFNPFSEEDENDQSSYTLVTALFSRMKNTLTAPLSSAVSVASAVTAGTTSSANNAAADPKRPPLTTTQSSQTNVSSRATVVERPSSLTALPSNLAPPLVSLTPVVSEAPSYNLDYGSPSRSGTLYPYDSQEGKLFGTAIPGFPIQDDARSIRTTTSLQRSGSVSKVIRRIRGEGKLLILCVYLGVIKYCDDVGLSRDYWMDDENCKECYDCESVFTTWRRKHHCRICGRSLRAIQIVQYSYSSVSPRSNILFPLCLQHHQGYTIRS